MSAPFLKLNIRRPVKDGSYPITIAVGYGRDLYLPTGVYSNVADWDARAQQCTSENSSQKNSLLKVLLRDITGQILELRESGRFSSLTNKQLKALLLKKEDLTSKSVKDVTLGEMFRKVGMVKKESTARILMATLKRLSGYCDIETTYFDEVNTLWIEGWVRSMSDLAPNTCNMYLRNLKTVC